MRVLLADKLAPLATKQLADAGCAGTEDVAASDDTLLAALERGDPAILVVRSTRVRKQHLEAGRSLGLIIRAGAGVNTIDVDTASSRAIHVANCPGRNAVAVAELTMGHLINLDRRLADNVQLLREGRWDKKGLGQARGLKGRTLAVLGTGAIGCEVIARARAFGMKVRAWSRSLTPEMCQELGVTYAPTALAACRGADALTVHVALTKETRGLVSRELLEAMRPGAYVINTSRGEVVDHDALTEAIATRGLRAGLDVFADEPTSGSGTFSDPIAGNPNVYGTHHVAASTDQAKEEVALEVVRIARHFMQFGRVLNAVNLLAQTDATHAVLVRHLDEVGVLAGVLAVLSEAGINVQGMDNIIFDGGHAALARIETSSRPLATTLTAIEALPAVFSASVVELTRC